MRKGFRFLAAAGVAALFHAVMLSAEVSSGLIFYWPLDEGAGATAADVSGSGLNGALTNAPSWVPGKRGKALLFDHENDNAIAAVGGVDSYSYSLWIKALYAGDAQQFIISQRVDGGHPVHYLRMNLPATGTNATLVFSSESGAGSPAGGTVSTTVDLRTWTHVIAVNDAASNLATLYVNGVSRGTSAALLRPRPFSGQLVVGEHPYTSHSFDFGGAVDEVRVYNRVLSAAEVGEIYALDSAVAPDVEPPLRFATTPSRGFPGGTTSVELGVKTDETAACRYGTQAGRSFEDLSPLASADGFKHAVQLTGLTSGVCSYFVKCRDALGHTNPDDLIVTVKIYELCAAVLPKEFYVAPDGNEINCGTLNSPWDLATALKDNSNSANRNYLVKPGATIWLRGGRYGSGGATLLTSNLVGQAGTPVILRGYPSERAVIDGGIAAYGAWTTFWGFEITNSNPERKVQNAERPGGLNLYARGHKAVNLTIHDTGHPAIGFWNGVGDGGEVYGCVMWGNGLYDLSDPRFPNGWTRGSGIYAQNQTGKRLIGDVISFKEFTTGFKVYTEGGYANGFTIDGNVVFDNNDRTLFAASLTYPITDITITNNFSYMDPADARDPVQFGYYATDMVSAVITGNYFVNGRNSNGVLYLHKWQNLTVTDNTIISQSPVAYAYVNRASAPLTQLWNNNRYLGSSATNLFYYNGAAKTLAQWRSETGFDANSTFTAQLPAQNVVALRPNKYEPGRGHVIVYNWENLDQTTVDLAPLGLAAGQEFEIRDAQNFLGTPVYSGTYRGGAIVLPLNLTSITPLVGADKITHFNPATHSSKRFNVFVVLPKAGGSAAPTAPSNLRVQE